MKRAPPTDTAITDALYSPSTPVSSTKFVDEPCYSVYHTCQPPHRVFSSTSLDQDIEGKPIDPGALSHNFHRITKKAGRESVRFHDLRHSFASLMLLQGAKPKVISEAPGHSGVAFTMDVYSHIIEGMGAEAMALLDEVLPAGINGTRKNNGNLTAEVDIILP